MNATLAAVMERVKAWPEARQREAAELLLALDELGGDPIDVDDDTLTDLDTAIGQAERGELANPKDVEAVFARYRK